MYNAYYYYYYYDYCFIVIIIIVIVLLLVRLPKYRKESFKKEFLILK